MTTTTQDPDDAYIFQRVAWDDYDGEELGCDGRREYGYLRVQTGDRVRLYSLEPSPGHWMNRAREYVFGVRVGADQARGWLPRRCLGYQSIGSVEIVGDYDGQEFGVDGSVEKGYLQVKRGECVKIVGSSAKGHSGNRSWLYVFGERHNFDAGRGWFPASCLQSMPFPYSQSSMVASMHLGSRAGRRKIQYSSWEEPEEHRVLDLDQDTLIDAIESLTFPVTRPNIVAATIHSFLGEPLSHCRVLCRSWALGCPFLGVCALQVKTAALFSESAPVAIARCINKLESVDTVCVPIGGGCLQRRRALLTIRDIHSSSSRQVVYLLRGFFGFFNADQEAEEMDLLQSLRSNGIKVFAECAIEFHPGVAGRVFVTDLLESTFMTVAQVVHVYFTGGQEILSLGLKNIRQETFRISRLSYQVVVADDPNDGSQTFLYIPPIEERLLKVLVYQDIPLDVVIAPGDINLPPISIPIRHIWFASDEGSTFHRPSLYQRVQLHGSSIRMPDGSLADSLPEVVLMSTGWLHVAGPDGSVGASIIGDLEALDFGPIQELAERATGLQELDRWELWREAFIRTSHVIQFRTMPVGEQFRSIVHINTGSSFHVIVNGHPKTDAFVLGALRNSKVEAREAAAEAAMSILQESTFCQPFPRLQSEEE